MFLFVLGVYFIYGCIILNNEHEKFQIHKFCISTRKEKTRSVQKQQQDVRKNCTMHNRRGSLDNGWLT